MFRVGEVQKTLCFTWFCAREKCEAAKMEKCKSTVCFKGGVGNARRADGHNRHFVSVGHVLTARAENVLQDELTEALQMTQHRWHT